MSKSEPTVQKFMTCQPHSIGAWETLAAARTVMSTHQIRHLPVLEGGRVIGILSDRDIKMVTGLEGVDITKAVVRDACHEHPYEVSPEAPLSEVALEMANKRYGSAIVMQNGKVVGIFTTVDACRALADILQIRFHNH